MVNYVMSTRLRSGSGYDIYCTESGCMDAGDRSVAWETECSVIQGAQRGEVLYAIILGAYGSELDGDR
jgi:hypothetical protein